MTSGLKTVTLAKLYIEQDHPKRAIKILNELLKDSPEDETILGLLETAKAKNFKESEKTEVDNVNQSSKFVMDDAEEDSTDTNETSGRYSIDRIEPKPENIGFRNKAIEMGVAVVDNIAEKAVSKLTGILSRIQERRR